MSMDSFSWASNRWALQAAIDLAIYERDWKRHIGKYSGNHEARFRAYHRAAQNAEKELAYWRERVAEDVAPWFDASAYQEMDQECEHDWRSVEVGYASDAGFECNKCGEQKTKLW